MAERRMQVAFDERAIRVIEGLQAATGHSAVDVIREALGLYEWAREQVAAGRSVAVVDHASERVREIVLPFKRLGSGN
jgi:hypothetical protein